MPASQPLRRPRRSALPAGLLVAGAIAATALAGCSTPDSADPTSSAPGTSGSAGTTTVGTLTNSSVVTVVTTLAPTTVTDTSDGSSTGSPAQPTAPKPTKEPAPVAGECPYLSTVDVESINGQRAGTTMLTEVKPQPICDFYRSDGVWQARVRVVLAATPEEATAAVDQHVPIDDSAPATRPAGWTGGSMVTPEGIADNPEVNSVYAVSKGKYAVIAESNQEQTIKPRQMVIATVESLGL